MSTVRRTWLQMQGTLPSRKSILRSADFQRTLLPWESAETDQQSLDTLRVTKLPPSSPDIDPLWQKALNDVFGGTKSAPAAMAEIKPVIDGLLQAKR